MKKKTVASTIKDQPRLVVSGVTGLLIAYALVSRAIDTGSWWEYSGCFLFLALGVKLLIRAFKK